MGLVAEDGALLHFSRLVRLAQNMVGFPTAFHTPASPDLNLIENVLAVLKCCLRALFTHPISLDPLWQEIQRLWDRWEQDINNNVIDSMTRRRENLRKARTGPVMTEASPVVASRSESMLSVKSNNSIHSRSGVREERRFGVMHG